MDFIIHKKKRWNQNKCFHNDCNKMFRQNFPQRWIINKVSQIMSKNQSDSVLIIKAEAQTWSPHYKDFHSNQMMSHKFHHWLITVICTLKNSHEDRQMSLAFQDQIIQRYENWTILFSKNMNFKKRKKFLTMNLEGEMISKVVMICQMIVLSCSIDNLYNFLFYFTLFFYK